MPVPDLGFINRKISIEAVARELDLRIGPNGNIHCWRPELHHNGDRTASVGIRKTNNTVKCFGCGAGPFGPTDMVMAVLRLTNAGEAERWIASRFEVPDLPRGKHLVQPARHIFQVGFESEIGLLVHSGLWAQLSAPARSLVPVLLEWAERDPKTQTLHVNLSYRALMRYSGVVSPRAIAEALRKLQEIHWLAAAVGAREPGSGPVRKVSSYVLTPKSDELVELAHANFAQMRNEIDTERKLRTEARAERRRLAITK